MCGSYQKQSLATYRVKYNTHHMQAGKMQHCQVHPKSDKWQSAFLPMNAYLGNDTHYI